MEKEIKDLLINLKEHRFELIRKRGYMAEHKFEKEQAHITDKIDITEEIIWAIEDVLEGNKKGMNIHFKF